MVEKRTYATEGLILARRNFGEADRLLTIFSKHYGKLRIRAPGVRRPSSRKRGALELFNRVKLLLVRGRNIDIVTDAELLDHYSSWREDLTRVGVAYHLAEIVNRLTAEEQELREIYDLLADSFANLAKVDYWQLYPAIQSFKVRVLEELGYLEREKPAPKNLDLYIEDIINGELRTKRFLKALSKR